MTALAAAVAVAAVGGRGAAVVSTTSAAARRRRRWAGEGGWGGVRRACLLAPAAPVPLPPPSIQLHRVAVVGAAADGRRLRPPLTYPFFAFVLYMSTGSSFLFGLLALFVFFVVSLFFFFLFVPVSLLWSLRLSRLFPIDAQSPSPLPLRDLRVLPRGGIGFLPAVPLCRAGGRGRRYDAAAPARGRAPFCERAVRCGGASARAAILNRFLTFTPAFTICCVWPPCFFDCARQPRRLVGGHSRRVRANAARALVACASPPLPPHKMPLRMPYPPLRACSPSPCFCGAPVTPVGGAGRLRQAAETAATRCR